MSCREPKIEVVNESEYLNVLDRCPLVLERENNITSIAAAQEMSTNEGELRGSRTYRSACSTQRDPSAMLTGSLASLDPPLKWRQTKTNKPESSLPTGITIVKINIYVHPRRRRPFRQSQGIRRTIL